jgi:chromosome partitioning protein
MKTIAVLNRKGGVGKTTIATNLARSFQLRGFETIVVDTDPQGSARDWAATQDDVQVPMTVGVDRPVLDSEIPRLEGRFDVAVIDGAAKVERISASAVKASDLVLIPVQPSAMDIWTAGELVDLVKTRQEVAGSPEAAFVISRAITGTNLAGSADVALEKLELPILEARTHQRVAYAEAIGQGVSVIDLDENSKAAREIDDLTDEVMHILELNPVVHE